LSAVLRRKDNSVGKPPAWRFDRTTGRANYEDQRHHAQRRRQRSGHRTIFLQDPNNSNTVLTVLSRRRRSSGRTLTLQAGQPGRSPLTDRFGVKLGLDGVGKKGSNGPVCRERAIRFDGFSCARGMWDENRRKRRHAVAGGSSMSAKARTTILARQRGCVPGPADSGHGGGNRRRACFDSADAGGCTGQRF